MQAAADYLLGADVQADEVAGLTPFSDATVRAATRKLGVPARRRGPQRKRESKPESKTVAPEATPVRTPVRTAVPSLGPGFLPATGRIADLLAIAADLTPTEEEQIAARIEAKHGVWKRTLRPTPKTPRELIQAAIKANLMATEDLRP